MVLFIYPIMNCEVSILKKKFIFLLSSVVLLIACFFIVRRLSFTISLYRSGFITSDYKEIEHSYDDMHGEFKVIQTETKSGKLAIVLLEKDKFGFWNVAYSFNAPDSQTNLASFFYFRKPIMNSFISPQDYDLRLEWNHILYGTNAINLVEFKPGQIPEKVTVNIQQAGNKYWIRFITYSGTDTFNPFDTEKIQKLLKENNCIE